MPSLSNFFIRLFENHGRAIVALLIIACFITTSSNSSATPLPKNISFKHVLDNQDLALGTVRDIIQDQQGFIWLGGDTALLRYDGYKLRQMGVSDKQENIDRIYDFHLAKNHILWIATANGLIEYDLKSDKFTRFDMSVNSPIQLSSRFFSNVVAAPTGEILVASGNGLIVLDRIKNTAFTLYLEPEITDSLSDNMVWSLLVDSQNSIWVGTNLGLSKLDLKKEVCMQNLWLYKGERNSEQCIHL